MGWGSNSNSILLLDFETVFNTAPTGTAIDALKLLFKTCTLKVDQKPRKAGLLGAGRHGSVPLFGNKIITGEVTGQIDLISIGYILKCVFGAPSTTGTGDPYTHVFGPGTSTPSFLLEKGWAVEGHYYQYTGCKAVGLRFRFGQGGELLYSMPVIAAAEAYDTSPYSAAPTDLSLPSSIFYNVDAVASEGGSPITTLENIEFTYGNNAKMGFGLAGTGEGTLACIGEPDVSGRIKGMFDADTLIAKGRARTESSLSVALTSTTHSLTIAVQELYYSLESPLITGPSGAYLDLSYIGYYNNGAAAKDFLCTLVNSQASYA